MTDASSSSSFSRVITELISDPAQQQIGEGGVQGGGTPFPLIIKANNPSFEYTREWLHDQRAWIETNLASSGAIVFRNFGLETPNLFNEFVNSFGYQFEEFIGGGGPRKQVVGQVYTSTESPADHVIPFHHELSYLSHFPSKLAFYCDLPPASDGETPILLSTKLFNIIQKEEPQFLAKIIEKKVRYVRILSSKRDPTFKDSYQRGWEEIFETEDKKLAEQRARQSGTDRVEWLPNDTMKVMSIAFDPVGKHPVTKEPTWFNSVVLLHPSIYASQDKPWRSLYGDESELEPDAILHIHRIMQKEGAALKWQKGDVLLIDNHKTLHSRNHFVPPRRILVSMFK